MRNAMVRKQVYLTTELDQQLRREAARQHRSEAEVLREALAARLNATGKDRASTSSDTLWDLVGIGASTRGDLSEHVDEVLYGKLTARK